MDKTDLERLICWAKYLYWAELQWNYLKQELEGEKLGDRQRFLAKMSIWYASLYVVIEGWQEAGFSDPGIDQLIGENKKIVEALRRFRNTVYHYQERIFEPKYLEFLQLGTESISWVEALHEEFKSFLGKLPSRIIPNRSLADEFKRSLEEITGWFPDDTVELKKESLENLIQQGEAMLEKAQDYSSPQAVDLIVTFAQMRELIKKTPDKPMKDLFDSNRT